MYVDVRMYVHVYICTEVLSQAQWACHTMMWTVPRSIFSNFRSPIVNTRYKYNFLQGGVTPIDTIVTAATAGQSFDRCFWSFDR